jgi:ABC-2 type transport system permease protein
MIIEIPANFEQRLIAENETEIYMAINAVNGVKGGIGSAYAMQIIQEENMNIRRQWIPNFQEMWDSRIQIRSSKWYNKKASFQVFMVPGILAILLTLVGSILAALNIVKEKEIGTIEQLNVTPIRKYQFIIGKLIPFWIIGLIILTIGLLISYIIHGIVPGLNLWVIYVFAMIYMLTVLGFGFFISNFSETQQQSMMISFFFMLIFILMSGLFTPIESMPLWAQWIAYINPVTYAVDVMRMVLLKGAILSDIVPHIKVILVEGVILNVLAIWSYRKQQ